MKAKIELKRYQTHLWVVLVDGMFINTGIIENGKYQMVKDLQYGKRFTTYKGSKGCSNKCEKMYPKHHVMIVKLETILGEIIYTT
jgi:hypothetical protein